MELNGRSNGTAAFEVERGFVAAWPEVPITEQAFRLLEDRDARMSVVAVTERGGTPRQVSVGVPRLGLDWLGRPSVPVRPG